MEKLTREEKKELFLLGSAASKRLLVAAAAWEFAAAKLVQERDEFGANGAKLRFYEAEEAAKVAAFAEAKAELEAS